MGRWLLFLLLFLPLVSHAAIDQLEYFFNTDPGNGMASSIPVGASGAGPQTIDFAGISTSGLPVGSNILYVRAHDTTSGWGPARQYPIVISHPASVIAEAEMFVDRDPGEGSGIPIPVPVDGAFDSRIESLDTSLDTQGWTAGGHTVYVRARNSLGIWGAAVPVAGTKVPNVVIDEIKWAVRAEYFFDTDPGEGLGGTLILKRQGGGGLPAEIDLSGVSTVGLAPGPHTLYVRVQDSEGNWGEVRRYPFNVITTAFTIAGGEFFIDADPGAGAGAALTPEDGTWNGGAESALGMLDVTTLVAGLHTFCIRAQDSSARWSTVPAVPEYPMCGSFEVLAPDNQAVVRGTITEEGTGKPLAGVTIESGGRQTQSYSDGTYSLVLPIGSPTITVTASGYQSDSQSVAVSRPVTNYSTSLARIEAAFGIQRYQAASPDPVNTATGNYFYSRTDLEVPAPGVPFELTRFYNAQDLTMGTLGFGWSYNLDIRAYSWGDLVYIKHGDGRIERFLSNGGGGYIAQPGVYSTLTLSGGVYSLLTREMIQYRFDGSGRLAAVVDRNGNTLTINRNAVGEITTVVDPAGRSYIFNYDATGLLASVTDPLGRRILYERDSLGNLVSVTDAAGHTTGYFYDSHHLLLTVIDPRGNTVVANAYDEARRVVSYQSDAAGNVTTFTYDPLTRTTSLQDPLGGITKHVYDAQWRLVEIIDALNNSTQYAYDANHNRIKVIDANGKQTLYTYDGRGNVLSVTDALGNVPTATYDSFNNPLTRTDGRGDTTRYTYDLNGSLIKIEDGLGGITTITRDGRGLPLTTVDVRGNTTMNFYDAQGNLIRIEVPLGNRTVYTFDVVGRRLSTVDPLGNTTTYTYDNDDKLLTKTDAMGNIITHAYDGNGNRIRTTDALGNVTRFVYDAKDQLMSVTDALGNITRSTYDANGNRLTEIDPLGNTTSYAYDKNNRRIRVTDPLGNVTTTVYDAIGQVTSITNAKGQTTQYTYDALGRLVEVQDAAGGRVVHAYDENGNRTSTTDPNGNTTTYAYDKLNRLVSTTEPLANTTTYAYDTAGNAIQRTDANGDITRYQYDALNRLTLITYPDSTTVAFAYDAAGHRTQMADSLGIHTYTHDALGRRLSHTDPYGKTVSYAYDANGNRTSLTYPGTRTVTYSYDELNRLTVVTDWLGNTTSYLYDNARRLVQRTYPNGTIALLSYDQASRLMGLINKKSDGGIISSHTYTLDAIGNPAQEVRDEPLAPILTNNTAAYTYDAENRLATVNGASVTFDANGNMLVKGADSYTYDFDNRLIQSTLDGVSSQYQYDGEGNRYVRQKGAVATRFILDTNSKLTNVLAETDGSGTISAYYVYGLGLISRIQPDGTTYYYHYDPRGSAIALTDSGENLVVKYAYDQFGRVANTEGALSQPFRYAGRYGVVDDGPIVFIRARYYDSVIARFLTKDTKAGDIKDGQSIHRYIYAINNPIRLIDISGFSPLEGGRKSAVSIFSIKVLEAAIKYATHRLTGYALIDLVNRNGFNIAGESGFLTLRSLPVVKVFADAGSTYSSIKDRNVDWTYKAARVMFSLGWSAVGELGGPTTSIATGLTEDAVFDNAIAPIGEVGGNFLYNKFHGASFGDALGF